MAWFVPVMQIDPYKSPFDRMAEIRRDPEALIAFLRHELCPRWSWAEWPDPEKWVRASFYISEQGVREFDKAVANASPVVPITAPRIRENMKIVAQGAADDLDDLARRAVLYEAMKRPPFGRRFADTHGKLPIEECFDPGDLPISATKISATLCDRRKMIAGRWLTLPPHGDDPYPLERLPKKRVRQRLRA